MIRVEADKWLVLAAGQNLEGAGTALGATEKAMTPEQIIQAHNRAEQWKTERGLAKTPPSPAKP